MKLRFYYCLLFAVTFGLLNVQAQIQEDLISQERPIKLGDEITVIVKSVDLEKRNINFTIIRL